MKNKIIWLIIILALIFAGVYASKNKNSGEEGGETVKIGALLSLSGDASAWGENAKNAIQLAAEKVNEKGGINGRVVEIIYEDTAGDPKRAVSAFQKVTTIDKVTAVIGPLSQTEDVAVMPLIEQTGTPVLVPGYIPIQNRKNLSNPLLIWMDAEIEASRLAGYVYDQGIRNVGVIGTLDSWETSISNAFAEKFQSVGGKITAKQIVQPSTDDIRTTVLKILATKPEAIFLGTYYQFVNATKALHDLGYQGKLYSLEVDDYLAKETAAWSSGLQFGAPDYYQENFVKTFEEKFKRVPGLPAGQAYDAANVLFAMIDGAENQAEILDKMKNFSGYEGVSGLLQIDETGRTYLPMALFELTNGKITRLIPLP